MPLLLVRHATAGDRDAWEGDDRLRPLDERGWRQAYALVDLLRSYAPERLLSSPYRRCVQTFEPAAAALAAQIELTDDLAEGARAGALLELAHALRAATAALSVHGEQFEELLGADAEKKKGSTWVLEWAGDELRPIEYLPPPA
jgi:8-oxo-dGTP diphosphatase